MAPNPKAGDQPRYEKSAYSCPHCDAWAGMTWYGAAQPFPGRNKSRGYRFATCQAGDCERTSIWVGDFHRASKEADGKGNPQRLTDAVMVWPRQKEGPDPNADLTEDIRKDFEEAREVLPVSPRAAAALLRLGLQKVMRQLGQPGKNINDDIAALVDAGLPVTIQRAADIVRVIGNDSVHPGQIDTDDPETVIKLFDLINIIAHDRITQPAQIAAMYSGLPQNKLDGIEQRDGSS